MSSIGLQVPALNIFESNLRRGKFDASRKLSDGSLMEFVKVYPMDAVYDSPEDVPEEVDLCPLRLHSNTINMQHFNLTQFLEGCSMLFKLLFP